MQFKLAHLPLLKIIIPFIGGILFFDNIVISSDILIGISIPLLIFIILIHNKVLNNTIKKAQTILLFCLIFLIAGTWSTLIKEKATGQNFILEKKGDVIAKGVIIQTLEEKEKTYKTIIRLEQIQNSTGTNKCNNQKILTYLQKDSNALALDIGDEIIFHFNARKIEKPKNPGQFDYSAYLGYKLIIYQQYLKGNEYIITEKRKSLAILRISDQISKNIQSILKKYIPKKEQSSLADGILLGHRVDIDIDLYNAFAYTGVLHILSVSGLHVGIIYGMLLFFLSFIKDKNMGIKMGKFIFILIAIWGFAFITGLSVACIRAAILFTLLNYGRLNREYISQLNLLCGAALLQLIINPYSLFDIGFQLSYLAMLGLFIFYKPIYTLYYHPNKIIDWTWKLWAASIAAQLFTLPLSIYYFGNFPTYFLLANIFAIPLSTLILWMSIFLIPLSYIPVVAKIIGYLDGMLIQLFIKATYVLSNLPLGKADNIYLNKFQLLVLLGAAICLTIFILIKKQKALLVSLCLVLASLFISYSYNIGAIKKNEIILYSIPNNFVFAINQGDKQIIYLKDSLTERDFNYNIKGSYRFYRINNQSRKLLNDPISENYIYYNKSLLYAGRKSFYLLNSNNSRKVFNPRLNIDYLILTDNCFLNIEEIKRNFNYKQLILSCDNDSRHLKIYRKILQENNISYKDLSKSAIIINF